jgi:DNA-binding CsgD family transcriptional regulator
MIMPATDSADINQAATPPAALPSAAGQPSFVGRVSELRALYAALESADQGRGGVVLLVGEPGIGKTRTTEELSSHARAKDASVLWGRCYEGDGAPAFWPWVQIIRSYIRARNPAALRAEIQAGAADIAALVPELHELLPDLPPVPPIDDAQARFRLFDSIASFLGRAAKSQPLILILDDLHWADTPSLLLLQFLAPDLYKRRILIVCTYRDIEIDNRHPITRLLAELARFRTGMLLTLTGLVENEVARFMTLAVGQPPSAALLSTMMQNTAGNPFFITELMHLGAQQPATHSPAQARLTGCDIPISVRGSIRQRVERLSAACSTLLTIGAVIGREWSVAALLRLHDLPHGALLAALGEASDAHLIVPVPEQSGYYRFVHALVRETLYDELPTLERLHLHQRVGALLEELYADDPEPHLGELAHHFGQAAPIGGHAKAIAYAVQAAELGIRLLAYEEAVRHYERALLLLELHKHDETHQRFELLLALGQAQMRSGETAPGADTFERAAALARRHGDSEWLARAALGYAGAVVTPGIVNQRAVGLLNEALYALGEADSALRARVLGRLAMEYLYSSLRAERHALSQEAVAIARRLGERATLAFALRARHYAILGPDTLEQRFAVAIELARLADDAGDHELALQGMPWRVADLLDLGHVQAADAAIDAAAQLATELRQPLYLWYAAMFRALRALMQGCFVDAESLTNVAYSTGQRVQPRIAEIYYVAQLFVLRHEQGRIAELEASVLSILQQYPAMPLFRCWRALIWLAAGRAADAQAELTALSADRAAALPLDQLWLGAVAALAEICAQLADPACAALLYDLLLPYAQRNIMVGVPIGLGAAATYLGRLAAILERWPDAAQHFDTALAINTKLGAPPFVAHTQFHYGVMLRHRDQPADQERATVLSDQAAATAQSLGMARLAEQIAALPPVQRPHQPDRVRPSSLTEREIDVLRLIASGKTTKQIAALLVVSVPTVERHITHIYEKIGARSRADATAYALRHAFI